ncbi:MAG: hypothetical protein V2A73_17730 [Pseudomonadota bacterium]
MRRKAERARGKQERRTLEQVLMPMVLGIDSTKQGLTDWVLQAGIEALLKVFRDEAVTIAGPKGKHRRDRTHNRWGSASTVFPLAGRHVTLPRPRVRKRGGGEVALPSVEYYQQKGVLHDPVTAGHVARHVT